MGTDTIFSPLGSTIEAAEIGTGAVTHAKMATDAIENDNIKNGEVYVDTKMDTVPSGGCTITCLKPQSVGQGTWAAATSTSSYANSYMNNTTTHADGDNCTFNRYLAKGTYTIVISYIKSANGGIMDLYVDAAKVVNALDTYNSSTSYHQISETTSVAVASSGVKAIKIELNGKNGSSADHRVYITNITFFRTA